VDGGRGAGRGLGGEAADVQRAPALRVRTLRSPSPPKDAPGLASRWLPRPPPVRSARVRVSESPSVGIKRPSRAVVCRYPRPHTRPAAHSAFLLAARESRESPTSRTTDTLASRKPRKTKGGTAKTRRQRPCIRREVPEERLLLHGADVEGDDGGNGTNLYWAAYSDHVGVVERLLQQGADVNGRGGLNPLHAAAESGQLGVVKALIAAGADVNFQDVDIDGGEYCDTTTTRRTDAYL